MDCLQIMEVIYCQIYHILKFETTKSSHFDKYGILSNSFIYYNAFFNVIITKHLIINIENLLNKVLLIFERIKINQIKFK